MGRTFCQHAFPQMTTHFTFRNLSYLMAMRQTVVGYGKKILLQGLFVHTHTCFLAETNAFALLKKREVETEDCSRQRQATRGQCQKCLQYTMPASAIPTMLSIILMIPFQYTAQMLMTVNSIEVKVSTLVVAQWLCHEIATITDTCHRHHCRYLQMCIHILLTRFILRSLWQQHTSRRLFSRKDIAIYLQSKNKDAAYIYQIIAMVRVYSVNIK